MRARLVPVDDAPSIELVKDMTLVGRNEECDVRIDHKSVSKLHCVLVKTDGLILVRDLGSTNGTRVNGQRVRRAALLPNDTLSVANFRYAVKFGDGPAPPAPILDEPTSLEAVAPSGPAPVLLNPLPDTYPQ